MNCSELIIRFIAAQGVDRIFGIPGYSNSPLLFAVTWDAGYVVPTCGPAVSVALTTAFDEVVPLTLSWLELFLSLYESPLGVDTAALIVSESGVTLLAALSLTLIDAASAL